MSEKIQNILGGILGGIFVIFLSSFNELQSREERCGGEEPAKKIARAPGSGTFGKPDWHIDCSRGREEGEGGTSD